MPLTTAFTQDESEQFPESTVTVEGWTKSQPTLEINNKGVHAKAEARLDFTAVKPNGEEFMLFSTLTVEFCKLKKKSLLHIFFLTSEI